MRQHDSPQFWSYMWAVALYTQCVYLYLWGLILDSKSLVQQSLMYQFPSEFLIWVDFINVMFHEGRNYGILISKQSAQHTEASNTYL